MGKDTLENLCEIEYGTRVVRKENKELFILYMVEVEKLSALIERIELVEKL